MGIQSRRHRRNRGERYERRQAAKKARHDINQSRVAWGPSLLTPRLMAKIRELDLIGQSLADQVASHAPTPWRELVDRARHLDL